MEKEEKVDHAIKIKLRRFDTWLRFCDSAFVKLAFP